MRKICLVIVASLAAGCVTASEIPRRESEPQMLIAAAQERGAAKNPEAQLHLKLAADRVREAQRLARQGEEDEAELLLLRAEADAEYALTMLRRDEARNQVERVQMQIDELHREMQTATQ